jgi:hypothetical protein
MKKQADGKAPMVAGVAKNLGTMGAGLTVLSVPVLLGYLGFLNQRNRNNITKDKEFEAQKRKLNMYSEALKSMS